MSELSRLPSFPYLESSSLELMNNDESDEEGPLFYPLPSDVPPLSSAMAALGAADYVGYEVAWELSGHEDELTCAIDAEELDRWSGAMDCDGCDRDGDDDYDDATADADYVDERRDDAGDSAPAHSTADGPHLRLRHRPPRRAVASPACSTQSSAASSTALPSSLSASLLSSRGGRSADVPFTARIGRRLSLTNEMLRRAERDREERAAMVDDIIDDDDDELTAPLSSLLAPTSSQRGRGRRKPMHRAHPHRLNEGRHRFPPLALSRPAAAARSLSAARSRSATKSGASSRKRERSLSVSAARKAPAASPPLRPTQRRGPPAADGGSSDSDFVEVKANTAARTATPPAHARSCCAGDDDDEEDDGADFVEVAQKDPSRALQLTKQNIRRR